MGCCFSRARTASIYSLPTPGESAPHAASTSVGSSARRRPDTAGGALAGLAPRAVSDGPTMPARGLLSLPSEILADVVEHLPTSDIRAVANTCRALNNRLNDENRSIVLATRAKNVRTLTEARDLLSRIETEIRRPSRWAGPLAVLVTAIDPRNESWDRNYHWRTHERSQLFDRILQMTQQVPEQHRAWPLAALIDHIVILQITQRCARFDALLRQTDHVPPQHRCELLAALAALIETLLPVEQPDRFDAAFLHQTTRLPPEHRAKPLAVFVQQIVYLHPARRSAMYDAVHQQLTQLPAEHRSAVLAALAPLVPSLPEPAAKFAALLEANRRLPAQDQGPMLEEFALGLGFLPETTAPFHALLEAARQLPTQDQGPTLSWLVQSILNVPGNDLPAAFAHTLQIIEHYSPEQRAMPLAAFARQIVYLPRARRQALYDAVHAQIPQLPSDHRGPVLAALAPLVPHLPEPTAKFAALLKDNQRLPAQDQSPLLEEFALALGFLPEPVSKFHALLEAARQLPTQDQGPTLSRIVPSILHLPANDLPTAIAHTMQIIDQFAPEQRAMSLAAFARLIP